MNLDEFAKFNASVSLKHRLMGIDFIRTFEYDEVFKEEIGKKVLDVGTWRSSFPLYLASKGHSVSVIEPNAERADELIAQADRKGLRLRCFMGDVRDMWMAGEEYDTITCISTIEHIGGKNGDIEAARSMAKMLKDNGNLIITVPFGQEYDPVEKWRDYSQRRYNRKAVFDRLVKPSGLRLERIGFMLGAESRQKHIDIYCETPNLLRHAFGWRQHGIALKHLKYETKEADAHICFLALRRLK